MPGPYEVLNARVKQKINTEAQWIAEEADFGVIFEGEQAFVYNDLGQPVNFKIGDGTKTFSELPYFIAYYSGLTSQKVLSYVAQTANLTIPSIFRNNSFLQQLILLNNSGSSLSLNIGTSDGGTELGTLTLPAGVTSIGLNHFFTGSSTLYLTGLTGKSYALFILYFQIDEAPAIPPTSSGSAASFIYGTVYAFKPLYAGHENDVWDFGTGLGKAGTPYENCILFGTNGLEDLGHEYLVGYKTGDTLGAVTGNSTNAVTIARTNLPNEGLEMFSTEVNPNAGDTPGVDDIVARARLHGGNYLNYEISRATTFSFVGRTKAMGDGTAINIQPHSNIVLYFTGPAA